MDNWKWNIQESAAFPCFIICNGIRPLDSNTGIACGDDISGDQVQNPFKFIVNSHVCLKNRLAHSQCFSGGKCQESFIKRRELFKGPYTGHPSTFCGCVNAHGWLISAFKEVAPHAIEPLQSWL